MPVVLDNGSEEIRTWLDPNRYTWSKELQGLLKPYGGELEIYPVSKEVGKVGNNSPSFIIPVASSENKSNIANFFAKGAAKAEANSDTAKLPKDEKVKTEDTKSKDTKPEDTKTEELKKEEPDIPIKHEPGEDRETVDHNGTEDNAPLPVPKAESSKQGIKRDLDDVPEDEEPPHKVSKKEIPSKAASPTKSTRKTRSATSNNTASPSKSTGKEKGSQKITSFFGK